MKISVIIVNYNTAQLTSECIESIIQYTRSNEYEIIVVDNASKDNSVDYLKKRFPDIKMISAKTNLGFGRANNLGSELAEGKYLFFLNSDTVFLNDVIGNFVTKYEYLETKGNNPGVVGCLMLNDRHEINSSYGYFENVSQEIRSLVKHSLGMIDLKKRFTSKSGDFKVDWVVGADMFIKKADFTSVSGFDPVFFMYSEEMDLQKRLVMNGKQNYVVSGPSLIHFEGGSSEKKPTNAKRVMVDESRFIYQKKHSSLLGYLFFRISYFILRAPSIVNPNYSRQENFTYIKHLLKFTK